MMRRTCKIRVHLLISMTALMLLMGELVWAAQVKQQKTLNSEKPNYSWRQTDNSLALLNHGRAIWQYNFDKKQGKPYFHPVCLTDGTELTWLRPQDHPWHRALWFSWKYINGLNYWEENPKTGLSQGRTEIVEIKATPHDDHSAQIEMTLSYHPSEELAVLTEKRLLIVSDPNRDGKYLIDWRSTFTAGEKNVLLDRTPIPGEKNGQSWGGYAGLSIRMAETTRQWQFIDSEGRKGEQMHGKKARWVDFSGRSAGVAIFDHPDNLRHPSPWYIARGMPYFSPAPLFNKPYTLPAGKSLTLQYRIWIHPGRADPDLSGLEGEWKSFLKTSDLRSRIESAKKLRQSDIMPNKSKKLSTQFQTDEVVREQLDKRVDLSQLRRQMAFAEAIEHIKYCVEPPLKIVVLWRDLYDNAYIDRTTPIDMDEISGVSAGTVLKLLLTSVSGRYDQLGYVVQDGVIIVATVESLPKKQQTRVYDISDLL